MIRKLLESIDDLRLLELEWCSDIYPLYSDDESVWAIIGKASSLVHQLSKSCTHYILKLKPAALLPFLDIMITDLGNEDGPIDAVRPLLQAFEELLPESVTIQDPWLKCNHINQLANVFCTLAPKLSSQEGRLKIAGYECKIIILITGISAN